MLPDTHLMLPDTHLGREAGAREAGARRARPRLIGESRTRAGRLARPDRPRSRGPTRSPRRR